MENFCNSKQPKVHPTLETVHASNMSAEQLLDLPSDPFIHSQLLESLPQIVWAANAAGTITYLNCRWHEYSGSSPTLPNRAFWQAVHSDDRDRALAKWQLAINQQAAFQTDMRLQQSNGTYCWFRVQASLTVRQETPRQEATSYEPAKNIANQEGNQATGNHPPLNQDSQMPHWVGICIDITEQKQRYQAEHFLAEAAQELGRSLDYRTTLASIARLAVPTLADWVAVSVVEEDGEIRQIEVAHIDPAKIKLAWELNRRYPDPPDSPYGVPQVIRTGKPELVSQIPDELLVQVAQSQEHLQILRGLGLKSYMVVPLLAQGQTLGAITFITGESNRSYRQADLTFAQNLADRAALAMAHAQLFEAAQQELTERRRMQAVLQESEARFRMMADSAPILLWVSGTDALCNFFNQEWLNFTGRTIEQEMGNGWTEGVHPDDLQHCLDTYLTAFHDRQPFEMEYRLRRSDGKYRWVLNRAAPRLLPDGSFAGFVGSCIDITERRQTQQALQARADELERITRILTHTTTILEKRNQELDQFAYVVSHDLKAPLRAIANLSQWIEEDLTDSLTDDTRHQMDLLRGRVHRMENLIDGLLQYSRIGRTDSQQEALAVDDLLQGVIDSLAPPATFTIEIQPGMPVLRTNRLRLEQVFANLITNAIKHHDRSSGQIQISVTDQGTRYEFAVTDDGPGIAPEYHSKVFGIFQTLEARDKVENTGIGLSLVKKIVEGRGGTVRIESQLGQGATFFFTWMKE